jgi:hypothetical protein
MSSIIKGKSELSTRGKAWEDPIKTKKGEQKLPLGIRIGLAN